MTPLLRIDRLAVDYRLDGAFTPVLSGIDLTVGSGERVAVIGESGSGKSTLALAVAGLLPRTARRTGAIGWPGLARPPRNGADIGFVFQDAGGTLDPVMSVGRQIAEIVATHAGLGHKAARDRTLALLAEVRLPDPATLYGAYPHQLSGGQRQRVGIAAAIAAGPALLIADEPTSALDTIVQARIMALIDRLVAARGMSLLLVTHDIAIAAGHCERIAVMRAGRFVEVGPAAEIVRSPASAYARSLLAATLTLPETRSSKRRAATGSEA